MAVLFTDPFTRADSDALGSNWVETVLDWDIVGNKIRDTGTAVLSMALTTTSAHADITDCKVECKQSSTSGDGGPVARMTYGAGQPTGYVVDSYGSVLDLQRHDNSGSGTLLRTASITRNANDLYKLEVSGTGATVTLRQYQNGTQRGADYLDTSGSRITTAGRTGIYSWLGQSQGSGWGDYDDFQVESFAAPSAVLTGTMITGGVTEAEIVSG